MSLHGNFKTTRRLLLPPLAGEGWEEGACLASCIIKVENGRHVR